jgi:murein DD-endopeptidase MepM/ murein hydrolase activator NlpD
MSSQQFDDKYGGYRLTIDIAKLPDNSQFTVYFKDGKISGFVYARWLGKAPEMNLTVKAKTLDRHEGGGPSSPDFVSPISDAVVTDTWGSPRGDHTHDGIDISRRGGSYGLPIHSVSAGRIVKIVNQLDGTAGGIRVSIRDSNGYTHSYNHMIPGSNNHLQLGQVVNQGMIIGNVGGSAYNDPNYRSPHLHYMIFTPSLQKIDPSTYNYTLWRYLPN